MALDKSRFQEWFGSKTGSPEDEILEKVDKEKQGKAEERNNSSDQPDVQPASEPESKLDNAYKHYTGDEDYMQGMSNPEEEQDEDTELYDNEKKPTKIGMGKSAQLESDSEFTGTIRNDTDFYRTKKQQEKKEEKRKDRELQEEIDRRAKRKAESDDQAA